MHLNSHCNTAKTTISAAGKVNFNQLTIAHECLSFEHLFTTCPYMDQAAASRQSLPIARAELYKTAISYAEMITYAVAGYFLQRSESYSGERVVENRSKLFFV